MLRNAETIQFVIILTSSLRHPLNSCGANAPLQSPESPLEGLFHSVSTSTIVLQNLSPVWQSGDSLRHVRLEARRMKLPALAACRACATGCLRVAAFLRRRTLDSFTRRVACIRLNSSVPISWEVAFEKGRIAWWAGDPGIHLPSMRWLLFLVHPGADW